MAFCSVQITPDEVAKIVAGLADPNLLGPTGIMIGGQKYMAVGSEKDVVLRGKKVRLTLASSERLVVLLHSHCVHWQRLLYFLSGYSSAAMRLSG